MLSFKKYIIEVWLNEIGKGSKEHSVTTNQTYNSVENFKKGSSKVGEVGGLHIYKNGNSHFTWNPEDKKIHHVLHAVEANETPEGKTRYKFLSAHARENSPVKMGQVYSYLVKNNNAEFVATGHSPGAKKMWDSFRHDDSLKVTHEDGTEVGKNENVYAPHKTEDKEQKKLGRKTIILTARGN